MSRYTLAGEAKEDLKSIYKFIAKDNLSAARRLRETLVQKFRLLATQPMIGEARPDLAAGLRMFPLGNYVILYRPAKHGIRVVQVVHSARDLGALWRKRPS